MKSKDLAKERIKEEDTPQRVDEILTAKYGFSLYYFAHTLADLLCHEPAITNSNRVFAGFKLPEKYWDNLIDKLEDLKEITVKRLLAVNEILGAPSEDYYMPIEYEEREELSDFHIEAIKKGFKLNPYFKELDKYIEIIKKRKSLSPTDMRGRPFRAKNLVALIWSYVMKKPDTKGYDWKGMADLFDWFSYNLKGTYYGDKLQVKPEEDSFDEHHLKREVLRLKANLKKNELFLKKINTLEAYYHSEKDLEKMSTIDFTQKIEHGDVDFFPRIGGIGKIRTYHDENLLVIFPEERYLARPGRPLERKEEMKFKRVGVQVSDKPGLIKVKSLIIEED